MIFKGGCRADSTYVNSLYATNHYHTNARIYVGNASGTQYGYLKFNSLPELSCNHFLTKARMVLCSDVTDHANNVTTFTDYDLASRPCRKTPLADGIHEYTGELTYNDYELPNSFTEYVGEDREKHTTAFSYDAENRPVTMIYDGGDAGQTTTAYDGFGRMSGRTVKAGRNGSICNTAYTYASGVSSDNSTPLIASISQSGADFSYTYDNVGNISSVTQNGVTTSYVYDAIGQLIRVNDPQDHTGGNSGTTWVYAYDLGGNILSKKAYAYTTGTVGAVVENHSYTYGNANWRDQLTAYYGHAITYDAIGNPTYDGTWHYEWQHGRQLKCMTKTGETVEFKYNADTDYDRENGVEKAAVELVGFAKTGELAPGASETVTVTVEKERFKSYDANGAGTYILDAGDYILTCAADAHSAVNNVLAAQGYNAADGRMDADGDTAMTWVWNNPTLDITTYAVSTETGAAVTNQLNNADINRYEGSGENTVTYVSRSDWEGTWPAQKVTLSIATERMAADILSNKALPETDEAMPTYGADNGLTLAALIGASYDDARWDSLLDQMTYAEQATLVTTGQFATVAVESVGKPATKENDGPTGVADTTTGTSFPSEGIWASTWNTEIIRRMGDAIAEDARAAGETGMYAGGVNLHRTPFDGRSHEYFSEDPVLTGIAISAEIEGMQSKGVVAHVKHYAFNEEETNRNGICVWLNEQEARELMLLPFEYAVNAGTGAIMTSFNRAGVIWTGANSGLMLNILLDEWGYTGYNITDMANSNGAYYMTWDDGVINGTDLYLGSSDSLSAYSGNAAYANRLRQASKNILYTIANKSAAMNGLGAETTVVTVTPWWQTALTIALYALSVLSALSLALYAFSCKKKKQN